MNRLEHLGSKVAVLLALLSSSCTILTSGDLGEEGVVLVPAPRLPFSDLPVPDGFELQRDRSWAYNREDFRLTSYLYVGKARVSDVGVFFRDQMPISNWKLSSERLDFGVKVLKFHKGKEACSIEIVRKGRKTYVRIGIDRIE